MHDISGKNSGTVYWPTPTKSKDATRKYETAEGKKQFVENLPLLIQNEIALHPSLDESRIKAQLAVQANWSLVNIERTFTHGEAPPEIQARRISRYFRVTLETAMSSDLKRHLERHLVTPRPVSHK